MVELIYSLLETCQDPLQIKAALHALTDVAPQIPIMVSVTIELSGTMLIGTDAMTIAAIMAPFNILSLDLTVELDLFKFIST